ncbi:MAG: type II toxin-antitoxin system VapC family toxin [Pantoea sp.]|uniref:type II toxin-antitoxin system VapC family toxin n=1 Tax=Pantoea sp. TaxID=69393 RepID=UPI0023863543|nr:type II toxin-antitoxin system VapC family toxin [Pantoea sp.]MDE1186230.1 type II toxin-antitoxin system VapC family toxin [Pantoea sp.]
MILVDTSVWIDHLRSREDAVEFLLKRKQLLLHPFVIGEIALGNLKDGDAILDMLSKLPQAATASQEEFLFLIRQYSLLGSGIGFVDAHLLATAKLKQQARVWTRDKRLAKVALRLDVAYEP